MKNALVLVLASLSAASAFATPVDTGAKTATITQMNLDRKAFGNVRYDTGMVTLDTQAREVTLTLYASRKCPKGRFCTMEMIAPYTVNLPIVSRKKDTCGAMVTIASEDQRTVDGVFKKITIVDNSTNKCLTMVALSPVAVTYETDGYSRAGSAKSVSTFIADPFTIDGPVYAQ